MAKGRENHGNGRTSKESAKLALRRQEIFKRWAAGESQRSIASSLRVSTATVCLDLARAWTDWRAEHRGDVGAHVEQELGRLLSIELRAQGQWEATKEGRLLEIELKVVESRRKLLGLDAPARSEIRNEVTAQTKFKTREEMYQEVRDAIEKLRQEKLRRENAQREKRNGDD